MSLKQQIQEAERVISVQGQKMVQQMQKQLDLRYSAIIQSCKTMQCLQRMIKPYKKLQTLATQYWATIEIQLERCIHAEREIGSDGYLRCLNGVDRIMRVHQTKNIFFKNGPESNNSS